MKLEHDFTVPTSIDEAWKVLLDVERVAPCMPGATLLTVDGDEFTGTVKVKVGPIQVTYKGQAKFAERDEATHRAVIEASGKEARGSGTAAATVTAQLTASGTDKTTVSVETDLNVTGRPAQFGRGVMEEVAGKLIGQFANCLADELGTPSSAPAAAPATPKPAPKPASKPDAPPTAAPPTAAPVEAPPAPAAASEPAAAAAPPRQPRQVPPPVRAAEPIDLLEVAGGSIVKRVAPIAAALAVLFLLLWRRRRRQ
jgi:carbon monoxide dehydrogenase subunit G